MDSLFTPWKTPGGKLFLLAPPPWTRSTLLLWDMARAEWNWPTCVSVMPAQEARDFLERAETAHARHGFYVLPCWRGLHLPSTCPSRVALDLQCAFITTAYANKGAR